MELGDTLQLIPIPPSHPPSPSLFRDVSWCCSPLGDAISPLSGTNRGSSSVSQREGVLFSLFPNPKIKRRSLIFPERTQQISEENKILNNHPDFHYPLPRNWYMVSLFGWLVGQRLWTWGPSYHYSLNLLQASKTYSLMHWHSLTCQSPFQETARVSIINIHTDSSSSRHVSLGTCLSRLMHSPCKCLCGGSICYFSTSFHPALGWGDQLRSLQMPGLFYR